MIKNWLVAGLLLFNSPCYSETPKKVTIALGYASGGVNDVASKILAKHLGKYIPGNPTVTVENHPGAGGLTVLKKLDSIFSKDGTYIVNFNSGLLLDAILEDDYSVDFKNYSWIGSSSKDYNICYVNSKLPIKSFEDLINYKDKFYFSSSTTNNIIWYYQKILQNYVDNSVIITGFKSNPETQLAVIRNEVSATCSQWGPSTIPSYERGEIVPIVSFSKQPLVNSPSNITYINNLIMDNETRKIISFFSSATSLFRPYVMSKDTPLDQVAIIRKAFELTMLDVDFIEDNKKVSIIIDSTSYKDVDSILDNMSKVDKKKLKEYIK